MICKLEERVLEIGMDWMVVTGVSTYSSVTLSSNASIVVFSSLISCTIVVVSKNQIIFRFSIKLVLIKKKYDFLIKVSSCKC